MIRLVILAIIQSIFLAGGQVLLKLAMAGIGEFSWTWSYIKKILGWQFSLSVVTLLLAGVLYVHMLKNYDFSVAYPITSISYIFGMLGAAFILHETIPFMRWIGVVLIVAGVFFIIKQ